MPNLRNDLAAVVAITSPFTAESPQIEPLSFTAFVHDLEKYVNEI
jgi:hypothetical protein